MTSHRNSPLVRSILDNTIRNNHFCNLALNNLGERNLKSGSVLYVHPSTLWTWEYLKHFTTLQGSYTSKSSNKFKVDFCITFEIRPTVWEPCKDDNTLGECLHCWPQGWISYFTFQLFRDVLNSKSLTGLIVTFVQTFWPLKKVKVKFHCEYNINSQLYSSVFYIKIVDKFDVVHYGTFLPFSLRGWSDIVIAWGCRRQVGGSGQNIMNAITPKKLLASYCILIEMFSIFKSQMLKISMLAFVLVFWTFKLVHGQATLWIW